MRVTSKGQVTIPIAVRRQVGLLPDMEVEFEVVDGAVLIRPALNARQARARRIVDSLSEAPFDQSLTTDEMMRLTRGDDWRKAD